MAGHVAGVCKQYALNEGAVFFILFPAITPHITSLPSQALVHEADYVLSFPSTGPYCRLKTRQMSSCCVPQQERYPERQSTALECRQALREAIPNSPEILEEALDALVFSLVVQKGEIEHATEYLLQNGLLCPADHELHRDPSCTAPPDEE
jgi:hypothetical protein